MATREEIITAIHAGIDRVESVFGSLSDEQLDQPVHPGEGGWTARDILMHLAARQRGHDMLFQMATGGTSPFTGEFDVDSWNRGLIDERAGRSRDELLQEFRTTHEALIERVQQTSAEQLNATIQSPRGPITAGDMLMNSGGLHSTAHADEVANALGIG